VEVDRDALRWWETLGTLKWGIMCIMQAMAHTSGATSERQTTDRNWDALTLAPALARPTPLI